MFHTVDLGDFDEPKTALPAKFFAIILLSINKYNLFMALL